jgi:hypothetical protein
MGDADQPPLVTIRANIPDEVPHHVHRRDHGRLRGPPGAAARLTRTGEWLSTGTIAGFALWPAWPPPDGTDGVVRLTLGHDGWR